MDASLTLGRKSAMRVAELASRISCDFPGYRIRLGRKFAFRPPKTIVCGPDEPGAEMRLLHEMGHALLRHAEYHQDAERLRMECAAWEKARELAARYGIEFDEDIAESDLDTYRCWLHRQSRCARCGLTRCQTPDGVWHCPRCEALTRH